MLWSTQSRTGTFLIFLVLGSEIAHCAAQPAIASRLRGRTAFQQPKKLLLRRGNPTGEGAFGAAGAYLGQRLQATPDGSRETSPFVGKVQDSLYDDLVKDMRDAVYEDFANDFSNRRPETEPVSTLTARRRAAAAPLGQNSTTVVAASLFGLGPPELAVIAAIGFFLFGSEGLKDLGKNLGKSVREVKPAIDEFQEALKGEIADATAPDDAPKAIATDQNATKAETSTSA
jgi:sec-independent protein translocase protein TatA